jgi:DNA-binding NarL/FixJ family response regulator
MPSFKQTEMRIRVAIVEDDDWIRENLTAQIKTTSRLEFVGAFQSGEEALTELPGKRPNVVLMDIGLPKMNGIECVRRLKALLPQTQFLMLTVYEDSNKIFDSLLAGASGYLLKRTPQAEIVASVTAVHDGNSPMSGHIARKVVQFFNQKGSAPTEIGNLSGREHEVLDHLSRGMPYKEIADLLSISINTVQIHIKSIYSKLHVHSRGEAVAKYMAS